MNRAAKIRKDVVTKRIEIVMADDNEDHDNAMLVYHNTKKMISICDTEVKICKYDEITRTLRGSALCTFELCNGSLRWCDWSLISWRNCRWWKF